MSLSNDKQDKPAGTDDSSARGGWGTIFSEGREVALGGIEQQRSTYWDEKDEVAYLARVKERAVSVAASILEEAKDEAGQIRKRAHEEGYEAGLKAAEEELTEFRTSVADSVAGILRTIEEQRGHIFDDWRADIVAVVKLAVEKIACRELAEDRAKLLENLLISSVTLLEDRRELIMRVHPSDEALLADVLGLAKDKFADVHSWRIKTDSSITPGGMVLETTSSLAESRVEARQKAVMEMLTALSLEVIYESKP